MDSYRQDVKNQVRETLLPHAIELLSLRRTSSTVIQIEELTGIADWFVNQFRRLPQFEQLSDAVDIELHRWIDLHLSNLGVKQASQLQVLYLCGPEPLNDLEVMVNCGVNPHNVWALTAGEDYGHAVAQICERRVPLKIHPGSLAEFFDHFNQSFDIIYFDACGPFCGSRPNTLEPIINVFQRERLNSPGILITNFCQPPEGNGDARSTLIDYVSTYFAPRYRDLPSCIHSHGPDPSIAVHEVELLQLFVADNLDEIYSDFITRLIIDIGMNLVPYWRAFSMGSLSKAFLPPPDTIRALHDSHGTQLQLELVAGAYPLASFLRKLSRLRPSNRLVDLLGKQKDGRGRSMAEIIEIASMVDRVFEGHWSMISESLKKAIGTSWFDRKLRITCDEPLPNLIVNSLIGTYGRPWFINPRGSKRLSYKAKTQRMYCDLFLLDQCRPYFDWFPVLEALPTRFESTPFQIVARCIMDRIGRHNFYTDTHPFRGASVTAVKETSESCWYDIGERISLN